MKVECFQTVLVILGHATSSVTQILNPLLCIQDYYFHHCIVQTQRQKLQVMLPTSALCIRLNRVYALLSLVMDLCVNLSEIQLHQLHVCVGCFCYCCRDPV